MTIKNGRYDTDNLAFFWMQEGSDENCVTNKHHAGKHIPQRINSSWHNEIYQLRDDKYSDITSSNI